MALTILPHGVCVDPDTVKILNIRTDKQPGANGAYSYTVVMRTDVDDGWIAIAGFDNRAEAEALSTVCARRINGEPDEPAAEDADDEAPETAAAAAPAASADDDW